MPSSRSPRVTLWSPPETTTVRLLAKAACDAPWHLPVATLADATAAGTDPTASWPDFPVLLALRDLLGATVPAQTVLWVRSSLELGTEEDEVGQIRRRPEVGADLAWRLVKAGLRREAHPALDLVVTDPERPLPPTVSRMSGSGGVMGRLEGDRFQPAHWLWQTPQARRLWTRATLELLGGAKAGVPLTGRGVKSREWPYAIPWNGTRPGDGRILLNAAILGSSGDGPLALQAGALLGPAGLLEVLDNAQQQLLANTRSAPWARNIFDAVTPEVLAQTVGASWTREQLRRALMSTHRDWRLTATRAMAAHGLRPDDVEASSNVFPSPTEGAGLRHTR